MLITRVEQCLGARRFQVAGCSDSLDGIVEVDFCAYSLDSRLFFFFSSGLGTRSQCML